MFAAAILLLPVERLSGLVTSTQCWPSWGVGSVPLCLAWLSRQAQLLREESVMQVRGTIGWACGESANRHGGDTVQRGTFAGN